MRKKVLLTLATTTATFGFAPAGFAFDGGKAAPAIRAHHAQGLQHFISISKDEDERIAGAKSFIDGIASRGIGFLSDKSLSNAQRAAAFRKLLRDSFDMKTIGRFALGRYWKTSTEKERQEYLKLFENMIVTVYTRRFSDYDGHQLDVADAIPTGKSDAIVSSYIVPESGPKVSVEWRVRYKGGQYKVVDIIVEKVSMSLTQRSDFASVIQRGGGQIEVLLAHLRQE